MTPSDISVIGKDYFNPLENEELIKMIVPTEIRGIQELFKKKLKKQ